MTTPTAELAQDRIDDFQQKHGAAALRLARYAALPVALNPDLLHLLRINFLLDVANSPDHTDEADLLLSPLCREIEDGLYEMLPEVRSILLRNLVVEPTWSECIQDVATLLWEYTWRYTPWSERPSLERAQQLTALNFLDPEQAEAWLEQAASQAGADAPLEREWFVAMRGELARGREAVWSLAQQMLHDPLTGLNNRRYLNEALPRELLRAEHHHQPVGVVMLDIDHFKRFNDKYGHDVGDKLLRTIGIFLKTHIHSEDVVCRYGGEEFILILPGASLTATQERADQIRIAIKTLTEQHNEQPLEQITISLGVAVYPDHGTTADALMLAADRALYDAKQSGRDRVTVAGVSTAM
jgi:diguanylate cyclase (GGDEF)-like protein